MKKFLSISLLSVLSIFTSFSMDRGSLRLIAAAYEKEQRENPESNIHIQNVRAPLALGKLEGHYNGKYFFIESEDAAYKVENHRLDPMLRQIKPDQLKALLAAGHLSANKNDKGEFSLEAQGELKGGGPWLSAAVFLGVQVAGFTGLMLGAMGANTLLPGAGTMVTGIALGAGGVPAAVAAIETTALNWSAWAFALPTP